MPLTFRRLKTRRVKLDVGDYSVLGLKDYVALERKSKMDFFQSLTKPDNFERLEFRFQEMREHYPFRALLVEAGPMEIAAGISYSAAKGFLVLRKAVRLCLRYDVGLYLAGSRRGATLMATNFLINSWELVQDLGIKSFMDRCASTE